MPLRLPECFRILSRHRNQRRQRLGQSQPDSTASGMHAREALVDQEAEAQHQQTHTEQLVQQLPVRSSSGDMNGSDTLSASSSASSEPRNKTMSTSPVCSAMLARASSHRGPYAVSPSVESPGSFQGEMAPQRSESQVPLPQFSVYIWGLNDCGQLMSAASPAEEGRKGEAPTSIAKLENKSICGCCLGLDRTWVWDAGQSVWAGGNNEGGCIDPDGEEIISKPRLTEGIRNVLCVAAGEGHTIAILENGSAVAFGSNEFGQLARGASAQSLRSFDAKAMQIDRSKPFLQGQIRLRQAACGEGYSLVLSETGMLLACGQSAHGCLGLGDSQDVKQEPLLRPVPAVFALPIKQVAASSEHVLALSISGEVFSWGSNKWGRLGLGEAFANVKQVSTPTLVRLSLRVRLVAASDTHSGVVVSGGLLYLCGSNSYGELSFPVGPLPASKERLSRESVDRTAISWSSRFLLVTSLKNHKVKMVALGRHFSMALTRSGRVFTWGVNDFNQLGLSADVALPLSPSFGDDCPPPLPHTPDPQPLWLPEGAPEHPQLMFYLIAAGAYTAFAAAVESPQGDEAFAAGEAFDGLLKRVLCRSRSSVGWEQRKLTAAAASVAAAAASHTPTGVAHSSGPGMAMLMPADTIGFQRLLTLSRGESSLAGYDLPSDASGGFLGGEHDGQLIRQESSTQDSAAFFLAGVSVEEVLRLMEGARSTGDLMALRLMALQVFSDVFRLNSSFAYPGHGSVPDFEGLAVVYSQLPAELLPLVCQSFSSVVSATMKSAQHLKRPDQIKFILFILACTPLFQSFCGDRQTGQNGAKQGDEKEACPATAESTSEEKEKGTEGVNNRQQPQEKDNLRGEMLYTALIHMLFHLPPEGKRSFLRLAKEFPDTIFEKSLVQPACRFMALSLQEAGARYRIVDKVWHCAALLQLLYQANLSSNRQVLIGKGGDTKIPIEKFQIEEIGNLVDPIKEVGAYVELIPRLADRETVKQKSNRKCLRLFDLERDVVQSCELQSSWCLFIAHLNLCPLTFKRNVLLVDNVYRQHHVSLQSLLNTQLPFLILRVRRNFLIEDACKILGSCDPRDLLRPLKVIFDGEEGVDEGGLRREFFALLTRELFSPSRSLFSYNPGVRTLWFEHSHSSSSGSVSPTLKHSTSGGEAQDSVDTEASPVAENTLTDSSISKDKGVAPTKDEEYWLTGLLASIAVYNDILMPLNLPLVVYKRLQGSDVSLEDLSDVFPDELNSFEKLLEIEDEATFNAAFEGMTFSVDVEVSPGKRTQVPLKPDGENQPLTLANRGEFVDLYTRYLLVESVKEQYTWFEKGFNLVSSPLLGSLTGRELQLLVCGTPELDFNELKAYCRYEGYNPDSPYIQSLWEILTSFDIFQKQNFLKFVSGSDRSPAFGLKELRMVVQRNGAEPTERLPTAYTCFCTLLLPEYATKEKLRRLLTIAIEASEGFGLQ